MTRTIELPLAERTVELRPCGCGAALEMNNVRAATDDNFAATAVILAASAFWQDTGEKVFADWRAVMAWPMCDMPDIMPLIMGAQEVNTRAPAQPAQPNGAGEVTHPSH
jgi:hypothetical protein